MHFKIRRKENPEASRKGGGRKGRGGGNEAGTNPVQYKLWESMRHIAGVMQDSHSAPYYMGTCTVGGVGDPSIKPIGR